MGRTINIRVKADTYQGLLRVRRRFEGRARREGALAVRLSLDEVIRLLYNHYAADSLGGYLDPVWADDPHGTEPPNVDRLRVGGKESRGPEDQPVPPPADAAQAAPAKRK